VGVLLGFATLWLALPTVPPGDPALVVANIVNAGAHIGASTMPWAYLLVPIALALLGLQRWVSYQLIARILKWLTLALFADITAAFYAATQRDEGAVCLTGGPWRLTKDSSCHNLVYRCSIATVSAKEGGDGGAVLDPGGLSCADRTGESPRGDLA
jgi:hypothetical protein